VKKRGVKVVKRILGLVALGLMLAVPVAAQTISAGDYTANPGDIVKVQITADAGIKGVAGMQILLDFSSVTPAGGPALTVTSENDVDWGIIPHTRQSFIAINLNKPGQINVGVVGDKSGDGPGTLLTIPLQVPANAVPGSVYALNLIDPAVNDADGKIIPTTAVGGKITIAGGTQPPPPATADISAGTYTAKPGDVVPVLITASANVKGVAGMQILLQFGNIGTVTSENDVDWGIIPHTRQSFIAINLNKPGEINVGVVGDQSGNGPGTLLTVPIKLNADLAPGTYPLTLVDPALNDADGKILTGLTVANGSITVQGGPPPTPKVAQVNIATPASTTLKVGDTVTLTATAVDSTGATVPNQTFTWTSDTPAVATVDATGKVTAVAPGTAKITAAVGTVVSAPVTLTVQAVQPPPSGAATISVATDPATPVKPGDVVKILINVDANAKNVAGAQVVVNFGALGAVTSQDDVTFGVIPQTRSSFIAINLNTPGEANIGVVGDQAGNGPGTLLTIPIKVAADAQPGDYPINLTLATLNDPDGKNLQTTVVNGKVTVQAGPPPSQGLGDNSGDLNADGKLTVDDVQAAILLAFQATPDPAQVKIADVNKDGKLSLADLRIILRRSLGLPDAGA